ncbi:hypothetical protein ROJ8625_03129 [Roseivivax jejudonensis]|uniref:Uncharacterized protein n=1 Tax=Roseivivax jejudonensis TaxID=1529041 RepID=A0A1X6ZUB9_9RHOB|nr:hypothetical protein [Roseivivax jejudonensis]SLN61401.1 hypothetical protein ROJ8625_03129 [Roseivivax jejudonensis]
MTAIADHENLFNVKRHVMRDVHDGHVPGCLFGGQSGWYRNRDALNWRERRRKSEIGAAPGKNVQR